MVSTTAPPHVKVIVGLLAQLAFVAGAVYVTDVPSVGTIEPEVVAHV